MYLIIFEDGSLYTMNELSNAELEAYNEGILDIVLHDGDNFLQYVDGEFEILEPKDK